MRKEKSIFSIIFKDSIGKRHYNSNNNESIKELEESLNRSHLKIQQLEEDNRFMSRMVLDSNSNVFVDLFKIALKSFTGGVSLTAGLVISASYIKFFNNKPSITNENNEEIVR